MENTQLQAPALTDQSTTLHVQSLYSQYAAMLLGYIFEVVKNMAVAEQYLIAVFKDVPGELDKLYAPGINSFCHLQLMARKKLTTFFESANECAFVDKHSKGLAGKNNKFLALMSTDQQWVFCGVYWHGKSVTKLAMELDKTEDAVRKILKECFTTIRTNS